MTVSILKVFFTFLFVWASCVAEQRIKYTGYATHRFLPQTDKDIKMLKSLHESDSGLIFLKQVGRKNSTVDILFAPHLQNDLLNTLSKQMPSILVTEDIESLMDHESTLMRLEAMTEGEFNFKDYWNLAKLYEFYDNSATTKPSLCTVKTYGKSFEGRDLKAVVVSNDQGKTVNAAKPVIFVDGGTHAREWITIMSCAYFLNQVLSDQKDFAILLDKFIFVFACATNPDGFEYSFTTDRLWRKTRQDNKHVACKGVDPNRNWGHGFAGEGSSSDKCSDIYRGESAFSIPETRHLRDLMQSFNVFSYCCLHSYSEMILLGYGCSKTGEKNPNFKKELEVANIGANALAGVHNTKYEFGNSEAILYEACGVSTDWATSQGVPFSYTFELRDKGKKGFLLPANEIEPCAEELTVALVQMYKTMASSSKLTEFVDKIKKKRLFEELNEE